MWHLWRRPYDCLWGICECQGARKRKKLDGKDSPSHLGNLKSSLSGLCPHPMPTLPAVRFIMLMISYNFTSWRSFVTFCLHLENFRLIIHHLYTWTCAFKRRPGTLCFLMLDAITLMCAWSLELAICNEWAILHHGNRLWKWSFHRITRRLDAFCHKVSDSLHCHYWHHKQ